jgi:hypothetical protein
MHGGLRGDGGADGDRDEQNSGDLNLPAVLGMLGGAAGDDRQSEHDFLRISEVPAEYDTCAILGRRIAGEARS